MRVLLIGQKIITLEDLNSYFFEHHIHGYASAGAPNLLSLDIVRRCGIHLVICQTSDYSLEHVLTFMNKIKAHDPQIVTLLITENVELNKIHDHLLELVDDFLVQPFTPSEFHARLLKLIAKSTSPDSKTSPEERLKSLLALMAEYPDQNIPPGSDPEELNNFVRAAGERFADGHPNYAYDDAGDELDFEMEAYLPDIDLFVSNADKSKAIPLMANMDPLLSELIAGVDFDQEPLLSELSSKGVTQAVDVAETAETVESVVEFSKSDNETASESTDELIDKSIDKSTDEPAAIEALRWKALASGLDAPEKDLDHYEKNASSAAPKSKTVLSSEKTPTSQDRHKRDESTESQESSFGRFLEILGRATYLLMIAVLILFSIIVVKGYYDGGVATFNEYGVYANTGTILDAPSNLERDGEAGTMVFTSGVRPTQPYGSRILLTIPWLGYLMDYAKTALGFILVIAGPLTLVFIVEIYYWIHRRKNRVKA